MDVRWIAPTGIESRDWSDVPALLTRDDGFVWVDILACDTAMARQLADTFGFHDLALRDIVERNHVPKLHAYPDHLFVVLHAPEAAEAGHIHLVELDQFVGARYLVTTHGPAAPDVAEDIVLRETRHVIDKLESGRLTVATPFELSYALVAAWPTARARSSAGSHRGSPHSSNASAATSATRSACWRRCSSSATSC